MTSCLVYPDTGYILTNPFFQGPATKIGEPIIHIFGKRLLFSSQKAYRRKTVELYVFHLVSG